jgi:hypothetical protein
MRFYTSIGKRSSRSVRNRFNDIVTTSQASSAIAEGKDYQVKCERTFPGCLVHNPRCDLAYICLPLVGA